MNLEDIVLNEINQSRYRKTSTVWLHLYEVPREVTFTETGSRRVLARAWKQGEKSLLSAGYIASGLRDEKSSGETDGGDGCTTE